MWPAKPSLQDLLLARATLVEAMTPAPVSTVMAHVEFLRSRYRARPTEPTHLADADARLWIDALAHWPADIAEAACFSWMITDKPFPPSVPGELLPFGEPILAKRSAWLWRVERMIEALMSAGEDGPRLEHSFAQNLRTLARELRGALTLRAKPPPKPSKIRKGRSPALAALPLHERAGGAAP
jgi:hypothetical protein